MRVGFAQEDTTPTGPVTLSGFIFRMNAPAAGVDDPLFVRALAMETEAQGTHLLLVFDLLGLGPELTERLTSAVSTAAGVAPGRVWLVCTHTHSAPATVHLEGCGEPSPEYWDRLVAAAARAGARAVSELRGPVQFAWEVRHVQGVSYFRRKLLADGRVVMAREPDAPVVRDGVVDDTLLLGLFTLPDGEAVAGLAHYAAHACTVCSERVTADYPGALCAELAEHFGVPFLFLPGAAADVNPMFETMRREEMLANAERMLEAVRTTPPHAAGAEKGEAAFASGSVVLPYDLPDVETVRRELASLERIAAGDVASPEAGVGLARLGNILNGRPGEAVDVSRAQYAAAAMARSLRERPARAACELTVQVLRLGSVVFPLLAAEVFSDTARALQAACPDPLVRAVGYGSPLVGYLPTAEAMAEGGYEAADAYVFYGHPGPFAREAEGSRAGARKT